MATNYTDLNGEEGQCVRNKKLTGEKHSKSMKDSVGHRHSGMGSGEEPVVKKKTFSSSLNQHHGINHHPNQFPYQIDQRYSTSEQVQYLISQNMELLQEVRDIKGFAGMINSINSKVEYLIQQYNQMKDVTDAMAYNFNKIRSRIHMDSEEEENDDEESITSSNESEDVVNVESREQNPEHSSNIAENQRTDKPRQSQYTEEQPSSETKTSSPAEKHDEMNLKPVSIRKPDKAVDQSVEIGQQSEENQGTEERQFKPDPSPTVEITRPIPMKKNDRKLTKDNGDELTQETRYHSESVSVFSEMSLKTPIISSESKEIPQSDFKLKVPVRKTKKSVASDQMSPQSSRKYKCKLTGKSIDNRVQYLEQCDTEAEPVNHSMPRPVHMAEGYPDDMGDIKPKEDKFLEELALTENFKARDCLDPKSNGADTVICIDTSSSMEGQPFQQSLEFINQFIDNIENWATEYSIEENIAIVHFGKEARILQQLTNDYNKVRESIENLSVGGPSPMMTGLVIAMSALFNRGGPVTVFDRQINPRVILLSDGNATDHRIFDGPDILNPNGLQWNMIKDKLVDFAERVKLENRHIITVPVGNNPCLDTLQPLAEITGGHVSSVNRVQQLSRSFFVEVMISNTRNEGINDDIKNNRQEIAAIARSCPNGQELTEDEMNEVITKVVQETEEEIEIQRLREQQQNEIDEESEMEVGLRVRRGRSWEWGDQDGFGTGTVIGHKSRGYVRVKWDCGNVGRYRHGAQNAHDLTIVDEPRMLPDDVLIAEGVYVKRGKDWEWDDQDGGDGCVGCVYKCDDEGIVHVRWESGIRGNYRFGGYGKMDLEIMTPQEYRVLRSQKSPIQTDGPSEDPDDNTDQPVSNDSRTHASASSTTNVLKPVDILSHEENSDSQDSSKESEPIPKTIWQYQMDGNWIDYSEADCEKIEKLYTTKKQGTLIVKLGGFNYRVTPHKQKQRNPNNGDEHPIRRLDPW